MPKQNKLDKLIIAIKKVLVKECTKELNYNERNVIFNKLVKKYKNQYDIQLIERILDKLFETNKNYTGTIDKSLFRKWDKDLDLVEVTTECIKVPKKYQSKQKVFLPN